MAYNEPISVLAGGGDGQLTSHHNSYFLHLSPQERGRRIGIVDLDERVHIPAPSDKEGGGEETTPQRRSPTSKEPTNDLVRGDGGWQWAITMKICFTNPFLDDI
ncbi:hypothetical protein CRG98_011561 [Punica granatum]|uniref:Uncharacterized protein n=1 Tax=Punica granatum TaxID=22663 RepID=A0A2I0KHG5_PUNGR|nr:hypothetical protein CRG98_011561 [Punica granatum]